MCDASVSKMHSAAALLMATFFNEHHLYTTCSKPNSVEEGRLVYLWLRCLTFLFGLWSPEGYPGGYPATAPTYTPNLYQTGSPGYPPGELQNMHVHEQFANFVL